MKHNQKIVSFRDSFKRKYLEIAFDYFFVITPHPATSEVRKCFFSNWENLHKIYS